MPQLDITLLVEPAPNTRCPCGSGRKFKKCCRYLGRLKERLLELDLPDPSTPPTPLDPDLAEALARFTQCQSDPDFLEFLRQEHSASAVAVTPEGLEYTPLKEKSHTSPVTLMALMAMFGPGMVSSPSCARRKRILTYVD